MKNLFIALSLMTLTSAVLASEISKEQIVCTNIDAVNECSDYTIHYNSNGKLSLSVTNSTSGNSCGLISYLNDEENKVDLSAKKISLSGSSSSSNGFSRATWTFASIEVDMVSGNGIARVKEGKKPGVYFKSADVITLENCTKK